MDQISDSKMRFDYNIFDIWTTLKEKQLQANGNIQEPKSHDSDQTLAIHNLHLMLRYNTQCKLCDTNHCAVFPLFSVPPSAQDGTVPQIRNKERKKARQWIHISPRTRHPIRHSGTFAIKQPLYNIPPQSKPQTNSKQPSQVSGCLHVCLCLRCIFLCL